MFVTKETLVHLIFNPRYKQWLVAYSETRCMWSSRKDNARKYSLLECDAIIADIPGLWIARAEA